MTTYLTGARARDAALVLAREARVAARDEKLRDERREVYSHYLDVLDQNTNRLRLITEYTANRDDSRRTPEQREAARLQLVEALNAHGEDGARLSNASQRVFLVSPTDVRQAVIVVFDALKVTAMAAFEGRYEPLASEAITRVHLVMRRELGIDPS